jgi:valyl-tRNA synthetase
MKVLIEVDEERSRLLKQQDKDKVELQRATVKLGNEKFVNNAPPEVVTQERERVAEFERTISQLSEQLDKLDELA